MSDAPRSHPPLLTSLSVVVRSLFVQASLNYAGMQNLGRAFSLMPIARWLGLDREETKAFIARHLGYFNSNPFISPLGLGALARMEADAHERGTAPEASAVDRFGLLLSTPLGGAGDALFWAAVRPQNVLLGTAAALFAGPWGALAAVAGFAAWSLTFRWLTFRWGWAKGTSVSSVFREGRFVRAGKAAGVGAALLAGFLVTFLYLRWGLTFADGEIAPERSMALTAAFILSALLAIALVHRRKHPAWVFVCAVACAAVAAVAEAVAA